MIIVGLLLLLLQWLISLNAEIHAIALIVVIPIATLVYCRFFYSRKFMLVLAAVWALIICALPYLDYMNYDPYGTILEATYRSSFIVIPGIALVSLLTKSRCWGMLAGLVFGVAVGRVWTLIMPEIYVRDDSIYSQTLLRAYLIPIVAGIFVGLDLGTIQLRYSLIFRKKLLWAAIAAVALFGIGYRIYDVQSNWYRTFDISEVVEGEGTARLAYIMESSPSPYVRANAILAMRGEIDTDDVKSWVMANRALIKRLQDPDDTVRAQAVHALGQFSTRDTVVTLVKALHSKDLNVRTEAINSLGMLRLVGDCPMPSRLKGYSDQQIGVIRSLSTTMDKCIVPELIDHARAHNEDFTDVAFALGNLRRSSALPYLLGEIETENQIHSVAAVEAVVTIAGDDAAILLLRKLSSKSPNTRVQVCAGLSLYARSDKRVSSALRKLCQTDPNQQVRRAAWMAVYDHPTGAPQPLPQNP